MSMNFGVSWSLKRIRPDARKSAEEAARRAGMPLDDWLNSVIFQQAAQLGVLANPQAQEEYDGHSTREFAVAQQQHGELFRRIGQLSDSGPVAYAPQRYRNASDQHAALTEQLQQSDCEGHKECPPPRPSVAPMQVSHDRTPQQATTPAPELLMAQESRLEQQLERITDRIKTIRQSRGVEDTINTLHGKFTEIDHAMNETIPRQAIETIERQVNDLNQRLSEVRQNGVDNDRLAGIEHILVEVRDAVNHLMPAENMGVFNDAIAMLAQKIDLIIGQHDPANLQELEHAITTLRDKFAYIPTNESVSALAAEVQGLVDKIDRVATGAAASDGFNLLEERVEALGNTLAEKAQFGNATLLQLDALVQSLTDKIEHIQHTRGTDANAFNHLEDHIVRLVTTLRGMFAHVASNETVSALTAKLHLLADKVDYIASGGVADGVFTHFEERIETLCLGLAEKEQSGNAALPRLDALLESLTDRIEQIQHMPGTSNVALSDIEDRIDKLDNTLRNVVAHVASNSTVSVLTAEIQGLAEKIDRFATGGVTNDVLDHLEGRAEAVGDAPAEQADSKENMRSAPPMQPAMEPHAAMQPLDFTQPICRRAVHLVPDVPPEPVPEFISQPQPPARHYAEPPAQTSPPLQSEPPPQPASARQTAPDAAHPATPKRPLPTTQLPANPGLPLNEPLEPESGTSQTAVDPRAQIAASKTALNGAHTGVSASGDKSDFIASVRHAAQAAIQAEPVDNDGGLLRTGMMMKRVKWPFIATTLIAIMVGSAQFVGNMDHGGDFSPAESTVRKVDASSAIQMATMSEPTAQVLAGNASASARPAASNLYLPTALAQTSQAAPDRTPTPSQPEIPSTLTFGQQPTADTQRSKAQEHAKTEDPDLLVAGPRFSLQGVDGGYLRLDADSGNVAFCAAHDTGWNCRPVGEDRTAREKEIVRLNDTVTLLQQQIAALRMLSLSAPPLPPPRAKQDGEVTITLPSRDDIARAGTYLQDTAKDAWQRLVNMISHFQKDVMHKS
jgi:localization factor PodJL